MEYLWFKSFHVVGVVAWFAGLFYLVRLFIYHVEADEQPEPARTILKNQYQVMERRLFGIITTPGMVLTVAMAVAMLVTSPDLLKNGWLHAKLSLVALLIGYHFYCLLLMRQLAEGRCRWSSKQLRALNEAPTVLLVVIVMLAVFKDQLPTDGTAWVVFGIIVLTAVTIQLYARKRRRDREKQLAASQPGQQQ